MSAGLPAPPRDLAVYVGDRGPDPVGSYLGAGATMRADLEGLLPDGWDWQGKRVLDFGCGSGRLLRHFAPEARGDAEFWGCDIDAASVRWMQESISPPFHVLRNDESPPLPLETGTFDLIWTTSVFSHLTDSWAEWLLELHRLLEPDGLFVATFMGEGYIDVLTDEPWVEDRIGMNVLGYGAPWHAGGPMVLHSPWWIRAHWGRAFDILELRSYGFMGGGKQGTQGIVLGRRRAVSLTVEDLEALEPDEPREIAALRHSLAQVKRERGQLDAMFNEANTALVALRTEVESSRAHRAARRVQRAVAGARTLRARVGDS